ncbi:MAG: helix-turn-helix domain-containing protein [Sphingobacteriales bacterium]|nr:helix-turn-helix domain-containing protein [Sphingobacteriales bacterium]
MNVNEIQQQLFQGIKRKLSSEESVVDEVAKLLDMSTDSVYRRMRGEISITFDELYKLATHYHISLDQLMGIQQGGFLFQGNILNPQTHRYDAYLKGMMNTLAYFNSFQKKEFYYLGKDLPVFHYFQFKELAAFKYFFWMGTLIFFPEFRNKKISLDDYPEELFELGQKNLAFYNQLDSYEIWNMESLNSTLRQIEYYIDTGMFKSDHDALRVYEVMEKIFNHLEEQAKLGYKFNYEDTTKSPLGKYNCYFNEIVLLDNSMMAVLDDYKMSLIPYTAINYMMTRDISFSDNLYNYIQNLMRRSTRISEVSEKERARFFKKINDRIESRKKSLHV